MCITNAPTVELTLAATDDKHHKHHVIDENDYIIGKLNISGSAWEIFIYFKPCLYLDLAFNNIIDDEKNNNLRFKLIE